MRVADVSRPDALEYARLWLCVNANAFVKTCLHELMTSLMIVNRAEYSECFSNKYFYFYTR